MKRLLVYSKDYCGQITIAAISSVTASIATVFIIDILRQIIECISIGNLMQEVQNIILKVSDEYDYVHDLQGTSN